MTQLFIGLISGTSMDGVDCALVDLSGETPRLVHSRCEPYPPPLLEALRELADVESAPGPDRLCAVDAELGEHLATAALALLDKAQVDARAVTALGSHGQTVAHDPGHRPYGYSLQLGDPNRIAERTGITTVADFRRRDIASGGQGAPLMPAFHAAVLRENGRNVAVLNIGGIANLTLLPAADDSAVQGLDTGPGNCLLDAWARRHLQHEFDHDGAWASSGQVDRALLERLMDDPYFDLPAPKSTGTQHFNETWLERRLGEPAPSSEDVAATLTAFTARTVSRALRDAAFPADRVLVCGGGVHNGAMMAALRRALPAAEISSTEAAGVPPDWVEAMGFAWLARETLAKRPGNLHTVTGAAGPRVLGAVYPGFTD